MLNIEHKSLLDCAIDGNQPELALKLIPKMPGRILTHTIGEDNTTLKLATNPENKEAFKEATMLMITTYPRLFITQKTADNLPVFCYVAAEGTKELLEKLLKLYPRSATEQYNNGNTALHYAAMSGNQDTATSLIAKMGVTATRITNKYGYTPLHYAAKNGHQQMVELLTNNGASTMAISKNTDTPLMLAIAAGHEDVAQTLIPLMNKTSLLLTNGSNKTASSLAREKGFDGLLSKIDSSIADQTIPQGASFPQAHNFVQSQVLKLQDNNG